MSVLMVSEKFLKRVLSVFGGCPECVWSVALKCLQGIEGRVSNSLFSDEGGWYAT